MKHYTGEIGVIAIGAKVSQERPVTVLGAARKEIRDY
jgi:hypothetical protein